MTRLTQSQINTTALLHNLAIVKRCAPSSKVVAMVKANAYGCGFSSIIPSLEGQVYAFGVACLEEAIAIRKLGSRTECILFQGIFSPDELYAVAKFNLQSVIHEAHQLHWFLARPLKKKIKVWVKVDTGMHRLGFSPERVYEVLSALSACPWVEKEIGLLTHFASADDPTNPSNYQQLDLFKELRVPPLNLLRSVCNSAGILSFPEAAMDVIRPGIMLYGVSPFAKKTGRELGLKPVMQFISSLTAITAYPSGAAIGYAGAWKTSRPSTIGVVTAGYGDGYPRHIAANTPVWINGMKVPIVGRVSMDMLTVDLSNHPTAAVGDRVELWGEHIPIENIASSAGTIAYELLCQFSPRAR